MRDPAMKKPLLAATLTLALLPAVTSATTEFAGCLDRIRDGAVQDGVDAAVTDRVLARVEFLERVIELDRRQPEFTTPFAEYLARSVTSQRVDRGRELLQTHRALLEQVQRETGVPPAYLLAFWGLETNYGSYFGQTFVPSALATLACDPRRSDFFTEELIAALHIVQEEAIPLERMEGSWAGAMGHVQFMPSVFLHHAMDSDGDGRRDLWNSVPDAMLSAGNFLNALGWDREYRWGREVLLPITFDFAEASRALRRPLHEWRHLGVTDVSGHPAAESDLPATLLLPAGHRGPAFLVYPNFNVILGWNRSEYYALAVGHLADRIAGAGPLHTPPPSDAPRLSRDQVTQLQMALKERGFHSGEVDGILGPATRHAIRAFQASEDMIPDGFPSQSLLARLDIR
jgi:membrane-bound lytic murein transglycosylase B